MSAARTRACDQAIREARAAHRRRWETQLCGQLAGPAGGVLTEPLPAPAREHRFAAPTRDFRFDLAWPQELVAVEVDGGIWTAGRHARGRGIESDARKYSLAAALGWRVLRVTPSMIQSGEAARMVRWALEVVGGDPGWAVAKLLDDAPARRRRGRKNTA